MKKKLLSIICMVGITVTSLAGCGGNSDDPLSK